MNKTNAVLKTGISVFLAAAMFVSPLCGLPGAASVHAAVDGWTQQSDKADAGMSIDSEIYYSGNGSLKFYNKTPRTANEYFAACTGIPVQKGKKYKYGFMAKSVSTANAAVCVNWGAKNSLVPFAATYDWQPYEFTYEHKGETGNAEIEFVFADKTEAFYIDDFYCYELDEGAITGKNLVKTPNFDSTSQTASVEVKDESEETKGLARYLEDAKGYPVYRAENITVDGDLSDWSAKYDVVKMKNVQVLASDKVDLKGDIRLAWDDKYLYVGIEATDDIYETMSGNGYWQGDCVQLSMSSDNELKQYGAEIGLVYQNKNDSSEVYNISDPDTLFKGKKTGNTVCYEAAIPWTVNFDAKPADTLLFNAMINDTDNGIRKYCLELNPGGISVKKNVTDDVKLFLVEKPEDIGFLSSLYGPSTGAIGKTETYRVTVFNKSESETEYTVKLVETGEEKTLTVAPDNSGELTFEYTPGGSGNFVMNFDITDGKKTQQFNRLLNVLFETELPSAEEAAKMIEKMEFYAKDVEPLMTKCAQMGYSLDYEMVDFYILQRFTEMHKKKVEAGNRAFITYQYTKLTEVYNELKKNLEAYIAGEREPLTVPRMVTSDKRDTIDGMSFVREVDNNGKIEERPYFYTGTGHWTYTWNDFENLHKLGYDFIHVEIGPNQVIYPESFAADWSLGVNGSVPDYSIEVQSETKKSGNYAVKLVNNTPYNYGNFLQIFNSVKVKPNTIYEFGLSAKGTNINNTTKIHVGRTEYPDRIPIGGTYDWTEYSGTYKTAADETRLTFILTSDAPSTVLYFDDVYVREQGTTKNLLKNGDFEGGTNDPNAIGNGWTAKYDVIEQLEAVLESAEENNMAVDLLITPHYFPGFIFSDDPTTNDNGNVPTVFMPFNPTHPTVRKVLEKYIEILMTRVKDYKSLHSVILSNEPAFSAGLGGVYYKPFYHDYLRGLYDNDISKLNAAYGGAEYKSFDEIPWPGSVNASQYWLDYRRFNDSILSEYHHYLAAAVRKYAPGIPIHTKQGANFKRKAWDPHIDYRINGADYELWIDCLDLNGNDCGAAVFNGETNNVYQVLGWYDWLTSVKDAPCLNTEDHILSATDIMNYSDYIPDHAAMQVWQGAIHGRGATNLWLWDEREFGENNALLTNRPMVVSKTAKTGFDLNRLAYEVTAVEKEPRRVAILKSEYSQEGSMLTSNAYYNTYVKLLQSGMKPMFLTDNTYKKIHDFDLVFIPDARYLTDDEVNEIRKYVNSGKDLVIFGNKSLSMSEVGKPRAEGAVSDIFEKATVIDLTYFDKLVTNKDELDNAVLDALARHNYDFITVKDAETGERVTDVEFLSGVYNKQVIVNLCNYDVQNPKDVYIEYNGKRVENLTELRTGEKITEGKLRLKPCIAALVSIDTDNPFFDTYGHWAEKNIAALFGEGIINGKSESRYAPEDGLSKAEFAVLLTRVLGEEISESNGKSWYGGSVDALSGKGIAAGELENPETLISREDMCALAVKAYEYKKGAAGKTEVNYKDIAGISADRAEFVKKAAALKLMNGDDSGFFRPQSSVTRAEATAVVQRLYELVK